MADLAGDALELHCLDDWLLGYSYPHAQVLAAKSLEGAGFEVFFPQRKVVRCKPRARLPSKTRHRRRFEIVEYIEPVLGSYLMFRRLFGGFDLGRLHELLGVAGLCKLGRQIATIRDYEVELLRLAEAHGRFNIYYPSVPGTHRVAVEIDPRVTDDDIGDAIVRKLDAAGRAVIFRHELGRIIRLIEAAPDEVLA